MWGVLDTIIKEKFIVDLFQFNGTKYIDSKLLLIKYMHYYLAKMEFSSVLYESNGSSLASAIFNAGYLL